MFLVPKIRMVNVESRWMHKPPVPSLASSFRLIPLVPFCPGQLSSFRGHEGEENEKIKGLFSNLVGLSLFVCKSEVDKSTK